MVLAESGYFSGPVKERYCNTVGALYNLWYRQRVVILVVQVKSVTIVSMYFIEVVVQAESGYFGGPGKECYYNF